MEECKVGDKREILLRVTGMVVAYALSKVSVQRVTIPPLNFSHIDTSFALQFCNQTPAKVFFRDMLMELMSEYTRIDVEMSAVCIHDL